MVDDPLEDIERHRLTSRKIFKRTSFGVWSCEVAPSSCAPIGMRQVRPYHTPS